MPADVFSNLLDDYNYLRSGPLKADPSGLIAMESTYPKVLLLASASYLETATMEAISELYDTVGAQELKSFVISQALTRRFHTLFDWKPPRATKFFSSFGEDCKNRFLAKKSGDDVFNLQVEAFLEIGSLRNLLVHNNYAEFILEKTAAEISELHRRAREFPAQIPRLVYPPHSEH